MSGEQRFDENIDEDGNENISLSLSFATSEEGTPDLKEKGIESAGRLSDRAEKRINSAENQRVGDMGEFNGVEAVLIAYDSSYIPLILGNTRIRHEQIGTERENRQSANGPAGGHR